MCIDLLTCLTLFKSIIIPSHFPPYSEDIVGISLWQHGHKPIGAVHSIIAANAYADLGFCKFCLGGKSLCKQNTTTCTASPPFNWMHLCANRYFDSNSHNPPPIDPAVWKVDLNCHLLPYEPACNLWSLSEVRFMSSCAGPFLKQHPTFRSSFFQHFI